MENLPSKNSKSSHHDMIILRKCIFIDLINKKGGYIYNQGSRFVFI